MLVLTRRVDEVIRIGDGPGRIEVVVTAIKGGQVKLGIDAPADLAVARVGAYRPVRRHDAGEARP
jgi:carbon storage regulator